MQLVFLILEWVASLLPKRSCDSFPMRRFTILEIHFAVLMEKDRKKK